MLLSGSIEIEADFTIKLSDTTAEESETVQLSCEVSKPDVTVDWVLNKEVLAPSEKFDIAQDGVTHTLTIADVTPDDSGTYTARVGSNETSAALTINGKGSVACSMVGGLAAMRHQLLSPSMVD